MSSVLVHFWPRPVVNWVRPGSLLASAGCELVRLHAIVVQFWQPPVVNHRCKGATEERNRKEYGIRNERTKGIRSALVDGLYILSVSHTAHMTHLVILRFISVSVILIPREIMMPQGAHEQCSVSLLASAGCVLVPLTD